MVVVSTGCAIAVDHAFNLIFKFNPIFQTYKGPVHIRKLVNGGLTWENLNHSK